MILWIENKCKTTWKSSAIQTAGAMMTPLYISSRILRKEKVIIIDNKYIFFFCKRKWVGCYFKIQGISFDDLFPHSHHSFIATPSLLQHSPNMQVFLILFFPLLQCLIVTYLTSKFSSSKSGKKRMSISESNNQPISSVFSAFLFYGVCQMLK